MPITARYQFTQHFQFSAKKAFQWCISYDPQDHVLMGNDDATRQVTNVAEGTIILTDTFHTATGTVEKQKLVQLYPGTFSWTSTHLSGPYKYSQFLYVITPDGKDASTLTFTGLHLDYSGKEDAKSLSERLCREDADVWKLLAKAMKRELKV